jgi:hypothetical protein
MSEVNAHDILCLLASRLEPTDQKILDALVDGLGICDIAEKLHVTHMFVVRHRCQIARLAINRIRKYEELACEAERATAFGEPVDHATRHVLGEGIFKFSDFFAFRSSEKNVCTICGLVA